MFKLVVLSIVLAAAVADPNAVWGGLAAPLAAGWGTPWAAGLATPWAAPIAAPLSAPVPAVAVAGHGHWVKKRSVVAAPVAAAPLAATPLTWGRSWVGAVAPVAVAAPIAPWGLGVGARVGHLW
ncbi:jg25868 [Pararge aegeria aegeria]|uniref:Jg25868 protein n=1 Tax=Pararge aegeria aegeria TaxID=348720 RepID=A0A8S4RWZ1_9NEOP|nr:jg25868 [Pararge aegeria aegeria]